MIKMPRCRRSKNVVRLREGGVHHKHDPHWHGARLQPSLPALLSGNPDSGHSGFFPPASRHTFGQRIHTSIPSSSLAPRRRTRLLPIHTHGRPLAEGRMGRKRAWGGREPGVEAKARADGSMGQTGGWGGREYGAEASMGRTGVRGRREAGADASIGRLSY